MHISGPVRKYETDFGGDRGVIVTVVEKWNGDQSSNLIFNSYSTYNDGKALALEWQPV